MKKLCIDIGNTRVKYRVFGKKKKSEITRTRDLDLVYVEQLVSKYSIQYIAISSVRKHSPSKKIKWPESCQVINLSYQTSIPIQNKYETPKTLGNDRLAAVIGAYKLYKGKNVLVIDLGTCIKFDFINKDGEYLGGNISPGVLMRIQAMHEFTSSLPSVEMKYNEFLLGKSTETALQNGAVRGTLFEIESFIDRLKENYHNLKVIFTGGDADFFGSYTNYKIFVHQNLVLQGLNKIIEHNEH